MALTVGTNSWATVAEADIYFANKWGASTTWATLDNSQKEQLLISAYNWINQQAMFSIAASTTADIVKQAQYEAAWFIYQFWTEYNKRRALIDGGVTDFTMSRWEEELSNYRFPEYIGEMLIDYLTNAGGSFPLVNRDF